MGAGCSVIPDGAISEQSKSGGAPNTRIKNTEKKAVRESKQLENDKLSLSDLETTNNVKKVDEISDISAGQSGNTTNVGSLSKKTQGANAQKQHGSLRIDIQSIQQNLSNAVAAVANTTGGVFPGGTQQINQSTKTTGRDGGSSSRDTVKPPLFTAIDYQRSKKYDEMFSDRVYIGIDKTFGRLVACSKFSVKNITFEEEAKFRKYREVALSLCHPNLVPYLRIDLEREMENELDSDRYFNHPTNNVVDNPEVAKVRAQANMGSPKGNQGSAISIPNASVSIVTDRLPSFTLASILGPGVRLPESTVKRIVNEVLAALAYLHHKNIFHGNIKAKRLTLSMLTPGFGRVSLFGIGDIERNLLAGKNDLYSSMKGCLWDEIPVLGARGEEIKCGDVTNEMLLMGVDFGVGEAVSHIVKGKCEMLKVQYDCEYKEDEQFGDLFVTPNHILPIYFKGEGALENSVEKEVIELETESKQGLVSVRNVPACHLMNKSFLSVIPILKGVINPSQAHPNDATDDLSATKTNIDIFINEIQTNNRTDMDIPVVGEVPDPSLCIETLFEYCVKLSVRHRQLRAMSLETFQQLRQIFIRCGTSPISQLDEENNCYTICVPRWFRSFASYGTKVVVPSCRLIKSYIPNEITKKLPYTGWRTHSAYFRLASGVLTHNSPFWMAPEVAKQQCQHPDKADIWSVGSLALELLTGNAPFRNLNDTSAVMYYLTSEARIQPDIPNELSSLCKDFLSLCFKNMPSQRPPASDLMAHKWLRDNGSSDDNESTSYYGDSDNGYLSDRSDDSGYLSSFSSSDDQMS